MKKTAISILFMAACVSMYAQNPEGGLSAEALAKISGGYEGTPSDKAVKNALAGTSIATLALNSENAAMIDTHFSDRVKTKGITDQKSSGRCWLFTGLNVLRARMIDTYGLPSFEFSQNYLFFYDQLEKSNLFLQGVIDTRELPFEDRKVDWLFSHPVSDGGTFTGVANLVAKYGVVPSEAMPETFCSNSTSQMSMLLKLKLREDGLRLRQMYDGATGKARKGIEVEMVAAKLDMLREIYRFLVLCLGVPPTEFQWTRCGSKGEIVETESYTPKSFYEKYVGADLENDYVMVMNDPCREYYKVYEIDYDRHVYDGQNWKYVNLPMDRIKEMAVASIKDNSAMYFSCDVGKFLNKSKGTLDLANFDYASLSGMSFGMNKEERVKTHASGSSHAMTLIAVDVKDGKTVKWMVENSWGAASGYKGCLVMTDEWFDEYMFRLVFDKKYVPADICRLLDKEAELLPAWDPMFAEEE